jgi:pimeloyl-ACP methyl ester carboxylesterase
MKIIYCISGLGADERAFSNLQIEGYQLKVIPWLVPSRNETLPHYAKRMRAEIDTDNPILMGLSFGGMLCIEIAKQVAVSKIIIISSIKSSLELPTWMKTVAWLKLNKILPMGSSKLTEPFQNRMLGISTAEERSAVAISRKNANKKYVTWAVDQAINWKNDWQHPQIYHIHGDNDKMFPINKIKPTYILKDAGHFMIMNRAAEVSDCINTILQTS